MDGALSNLLIACRFSTIFLVFSIKKRIFWQIYEQYKGDLIMMLGINAKDRSVYVSFVLKSCKKFGDVRGIMYLCLRLAASQQLERASLRSICTIFA